jgi:Xaa-Pro aminopeptidase
MTPTTANTNAPRMTAPPQTYINRRAAFAKSLNRPIVLFAGCARSRNYIGAEFPFRAASSYLYLGGPPIEGAALLIEPGSDGENGSLLLRPPSSFDDAVWVGEAIPDAQLATESGLPIENITNTAKIDALLANQSAAAFIPPCLQTDRWARTLNLDAPNSDEFLALADLRLIKDEYEIAALRRAAKVGVLAHRAAMEAALPGATEADVAAAHRAVLIQHQCHPSFTPITTTRGEILHYLEFPNTLQEGKLLLIDAGAEEPSGYASDITRTVPIGPFSDIQRAVYNVVLSAQKSAADACTPGTRFRDIHDLAARRICEGLTEIDILKGEAGALFERKAHTLFFTHGLGHLIGLDVHDMEDYGDIAGYTPGRSRRTAFGDKFLRLDRDLEPGYAVTIEPGFYVVPAIWQNDDFLKPFVDCVNRPLIDDMLQSWFGGIRIEDDILVTDGQPENLTADLPKDADGVTAITAAARSA